MRHWLTVTLFAAVAFSFSPPAIGQESEDMVSGSPTIIYGGPTDARRYSIRNSAAVLSIIAPGMMRGEVVGDIRYIHNEARSWSDGRAEIIFYLTENDDVENITAVGIASGVDLAASGGERTFSLEAFRNGVYRNLIALNVRIRKTGN